MRSADVSNDGSRAFFSHACDHVPQMVDSCSWGLLHNESSLAGLKTDLLRTRGGRKAPFTHRANSDWGAPGLLSQIDELQQGRSDDEEEFVQEEEEVRSSGGSESGESPGV